VARELGDEKYAASVAQKILSVVGKPLTLIGHDFRVTTSIGIASSLAALQRFPLDTITIDLSFIHDITGATENSGLADAVIAMGKSLSMTVVAQGVETREQAAFLQAHTCDELQGFYFKRPLPAEQFRQLLHAQTNAITYIGRDLAVKIV
jgi:hypothetical protein